MVEKPIKKSERQITAAKSDVGEDVKEQPRFNEERSDSKTGGSFQKKDRRKGKDKGSHQESRPKNVNPALVRGPRPSKAKPPVLAETPSETVEDTETTEDSVTETPEETTAEE